MKIVPFNKDRNRYITKGYSIYNNQGSKQVESNQTKVGSPN